MNEIVEKYNQSLYDINASKIWKFINDDFINFAMVSSYDGDKDQKFNTEKSDELHNDIKGLSLDFIKLSGGYEKIDKYGDTVRTKLNACIFMIADVTMEQILELGLRYKQSFILLKDFNVFSYVSTTVGNDMSIGSFLHEGFKSIDYDNGFEFAKAVIKDFYQQLFENSSRYNLNQVNGGQQFFLLEYRPMPFDPGLYCAMAGYKSGYFKRI